MAKRAHSLEKVKRANFFAKWPSGSEAAICDSSTPYWYRAGANAGGDAFHRLGGAVTFTRHRKDKKSPLQLLIGVEHQSLLVI